MTKYEANDSQFVSDFLTSLYVDDFNEGKDSVSEAFELYKKSKIKNEELEWSWIQFKEVEVKF